MVPADSNVTGVGYIAIGQTIRGFSKRQMTINKFIEVKMSLNIENDVHKIVIYCLLFKVPFLIKSLGCTWSAGKSS